MPCNGEESNHLATASSSFCLEIELRPRNKATSIIKGVSGEQDHSPNSVRTTSSLLKLPYCTSDRHILDHKHLNPPSCLLMCPSLSFNVIQTLFYLFHLTFHLPLLHIFHPFLPAPSPPSPSFSWNQFRSMNTFCRRLITSLMELLY